MAADTTAATALGTALLVAVTVVKTFQYTHSTVYTLITAVAVGSLIRTLEVCRNTRRTQHLLPVLQRYPGSTAV
jgi:hypothetical protein